MDDLVGDFIAETREGLEALDSELVRFEQHPDDPEILGNVFRLIHTIKGTCGFLGLTRLQTVAHAAENVLGAFRDGSLVVSTEAVSAVLETVDLIRSIIDALARTGAEPVGDDGRLIGRLEAVFAAPAAASAPPASLVERLGGDATLDAAAEILLARIAGEAALLALFEATDPDVFQGAVRDALCARARNGGPDLLADALRRCASAPLSEACLATVRRHLAEALASLDAAPEAVTALLSASAPPQNAAPHAAPPVAPPPATEAEAGAQTIRVNVDSLEHLMTVVSELVLIRNQLIQTLRAQPESPFAAPLNRLNQVTSELQEGVMTTRMQPIAGAWAKMPRLVRDLSRDLGKKIELVQHGQETELDRQVLELIKDPLTHMIRNAADHGLETPAERLAAGKPDAGRITLGARHEGGAIIIEVSDDGRGLSAARIRAKAVSSGIATPAQADAMSDAEALQLIFRAGFSTAAQVTAVSGRGVGMDVVRTNIERIGGAIELQSAEGTGTRFTIRIPLTLSIVQALIVECCGIRFAMPQSGVVELVSANDSSNRSIEYINGAAVLRLRDRLLPLISLQALLGLDPRESRRGDACIVVAEVGAFTFGVIVDRVFDTEEIVVKPVSGILRHLRIYSGATIVGDGSVIMILDFKGMAGEAGVDQVAAAVQSRQPALEAATGVREALLVFKTAHGAPKAARLASVARIEEVRLADVEIVDGRTVVQYRGGLMPIVGVDGANAQPSSDTRAHPLLVYAREDRHIGLLVDEIVDIVETHVEPSLSPNGAGSLGSLTVAGRATELVDIGHFWRRLFSEASAAHTAAPRARRLLVVDQSPFCTVLLKPLLARAGYDVTLCATPEDAVALHAAGDAFDLIMADISGHAAQAERLARAFRHAERWRDTPLVQLALAGTGGIDGADLVSAVNDTLQPVRGAA
ncbi:MAG: hybrid sensor histidine kinase/response regulator [Hyphomonadaceae bacterium]|nr:hybrid sensor histidine kinase/response regulator [Hyphomonadaceae bacterium]